MAAGATLENNLMKTLGQKFSKQAVAETRILEAILYTDLLPVRDEADQKRVGEGGGSGRWGIWEVGGLGG